MHSHNREVGRKLLIATASMVVLPVATYVLSEQYLFATKRNPDNWAAAAAIVVTNIIVGVYCYMAFCEKDEDDETQYGGHAGPKVGIFKHRKERID